MTSPVSEPVALHAPEPAAADPEVLGRLSALRARDPGAIRRAWAARRRRPFVTAADGRVLIVAADHPARAALRAGADPHAMADRAGLLTRLCTALANPAVDGVLAAPDLLDDLLLLGALEGRLAIGSMNRAGLPGARFEIDDRFTGTSAASVRRDGLDGAKMLLRIDADDPASAPALERCAAAVTELAAADAVAMVEPFLCRRVGDRLVNDLSTDAVVASATVAAGLGNTSAHTWLKLPVTGDFARVAGATSLPVVLLGGEVEADAVAQRKTWASALTQPTVRGLTVGRSLLFPPDGDVAGAVAQAAVLLGREPSRMDEWEHR